MQVGVYQLFVLLAAWAYAATVAVLFVFAREVLGESYCQRHLADTRRTEEQVAVAHAVFLVSLHEPALDFVLSYYVLESHFCKNENKPQRYEKISEYLFRLRFSFQNFYVADVARNIVTNFEINSAQNCIRCNDYIRCKSLRRYNHQILNRYNYVKFLLKQQTLGNVFAL